MLPGGIPLSSSRHGQSEASRVTAVSWFSRILLAGQNQFSKSNNQLLSLYSYIHKYSRPIRELFRALRCTKSVSFPGRSGPKGVSFPGKRCFRSRYFGVSNPGSWCFISRYTLVHRSARYLQPPLPTSTDLNLASSVSGFGNSGKQNQRAAWLLPRNQGCTDARSVASLMR